MDEKAVQAVAEVTGAHHGLGPSNYTQWFDCPQWEGKPGGGTDAERGSFSHLVMQSILQGDSSILPEVVPTCVTMDDIESGRWGAEAVRQLAGGAEIHSESRVRFSDAMAVDFPVLKGVFGTVDAWFVDDANQLHVVDYKTFDRSEKDYTPQMSGYAVLLCSQHPEFAGGRIYLHVASGGTREVTTYATDFTTAVSLVGRIIVAHLSPDSRPCPCDACKHCAKAAHCPGVSNVVSIVQPTAVAWDAMHLADKKVLVDALKKVIRNFEADFLAELKEKGSVESPATGVRWELATKAPPRECGPMVDLYKDMAAFGVTRDQFMRDVCTATQTAVKSALAVASPGIAASDVKGLIDRNWRIPDGAVGSPTAKRVA